MFVCLRCRKTGVNLFEDCPHCGNALDPESVVRPISTLLEQLRDCDVCGEEKSFDGWQCYKCTRTISDKAKKMYGCVLLNNNEVELVKAHFDGSLQELKTTMEDFVKGDRESI